jgi:formylglycine-generating enzyme required for sulfatase activity
VKLGRALLLAVSFASVASAAPCPPDMVQVDSYCVDRFEISTVDQDTGQPLSPFYPPERRWYGFVFDMWEVQRTTVGEPNARNMPLPELSQFQQQADPNPVAQSTRGVVPQGYISYYSAKRACERAGKRLCSDSEWEHACRGQQDTLYPYGDTYRDAPCNVSRPHHPAFVLHSLSSAGHLDPRLNLLVIDGDEPVLWLTGASEQCTSRWGDDAIYDMVGNLDEWVDSAEGVFRGGFYARKTDRGCEARISSHSAAYFDYSTGTRCCKDATLATP